MSRASAWVPALLCVATLGGCTLLDPLGEELDELESARARWERVGPPSYRVTETRVCFCGPDLVRPVLILVTTSEVIRTYASDGTPVAPANEKFFPTVEQLFEEIEEAIDRGADKVEVRYDPASGAPLEVFIDEMERAADEEVRWTLTPPEPL